MSEHHCSSSNSGQYIIGNILPIVLVGQYNSTYMDRKIGCITVVGGKSKQKQMYTRANTCGLLNLLTTTCMNFNTATFDCTWKILTFINFYIQIIQNFLDSTSLFNKELVYNIKKNWYLL